MTMKNIISIVILHTVVYCIKKNFFFISVSVCVAVIRDYYY